MSETIIKHVLTFPEGTFLLTDQLTPYFLGPCNTKAYLCYGERKELLGKYVHRLPPCKDAPEGECLNFFLAYEFEDNQLISARSMWQGHEKSKGSLAEPNVTAAMNTALKNGKLTLEHPKTRANICRVAKIDDQNDLILIDSSDDRPRHTIYIGKPGNYTKLQPKSYAQGGNSFYFQDIGNGKALSLPYGIGGPRPDEAPTYDGQHIYYQKIEDRYDFAKYGLPEPVITEHLGPKPNPIGSPLPPSGVNPPKPPQR